MILNNYTPFVKLQLFTLWLCFHDDTLPLLSSFLFLVFATGGVINNFDTVFVFACVVCVGHYDCCLGCVVFLLALSNVSKCRNYL